MSSIYIYYCLPESFCQSHLKRIYYSLSVDEKDRLFHIVSEEDKNNFIISHSVLRYGVDNFFDLSNYSQNIEFNQNEPPKIKGKNNQMLNLTLSNTRKLAICALSNCTDIGIDAELIQNKDYSEVYPFCLTKNEIKEIESLEGSAKEFLVLWTKKESYLKAIKVGLKANPKDIECSVHSNKILDLSKNSVEPNEWFVKTINITTDHVCSLAYKDHCSLDLSISQILPDELLNFFNKKLVC